MVTPELIQYIKDLKTKKVSDEEIIKNLLAAGWQKEDIREAFLRITPPIPMPGEAPLPHERTGTAGQHERAPEHGSQAAPREESGAYAPTGGQAHYKPVSVSPQERFARASQQKAPRNKVLLSLIVGFIGLVLFGASGYAAYVFLNPTFEEMLVRMIVALPEIDSGNVEFSVAASFKPNAQLRARNPEIAKALGNRDVYELSFQAHGTFDYLDKEKPQEQITFSLNENTGQEVLLSGEFRWIDDIQYFILENAPDLRTMGYDLRPYIGQWFRRDASGVRDRFIEEINKENEERTQESDEEEDRKMQDQIEEAYKKYPAFTVIEPVEKEVHGVPVRSYKVELNKENAVLFLEELDRILDDEGRLYRESLKRDLQRVESAEIVISIGKDDNYPYEILYDVSGEEPELGDITLSFGLTAKEYNKPHPVREPVGAVDFEQFLQRRLMRELITDESPSESGRAGSL